MQQNRNFTSGRCLQDYGGKPLIIDMDWAAGENETYRTALWTGQYLQVTLMSIPVGGDIGLEIHEETDQFIRIEQGCGMVQFGCTREDVKNIDSVSSRDAVLIPAGTWHNIVNCGRIPLKLYSVYAPPHHPFGTVQAGKEA